MGESDKQKLKKSIQEYWVNAGSVNIGGSIFLDFLRSIQNHPTPRITHSKAGKPEYLLIVNVAPGGTNFSPNSSSELHIPGPMGSCLSLRYYPAGKAAVDSAIGQK